jgi:hypothetical protein
MANRHKIDRRTTRSDIKGSAPAKVECKEGIVPSRDNSSLCSLYAEQSAQGIDWRRASLI